MYEPLLSVPAASYYWDFGDGESSTLPNPIHTYVDIGKYDVKLKVLYDLVDCQQIDSLVKVGYVSAGLDAQFSATPNTGTSPLTVQFSDFSQGSPTSWFWDFGDGSTSTESNPLHQYFGEGDYDVFLRVSNGVTSDSLIQPDCIHVGAAHVDLFAAYGYSGDTRPGFDAWFGAWWANLGTSAAHTCTLKVLPPQEVSLVGVDCTVLASGDCGQYTIKGDTVIIPLGTINADVMHYGGYANIQVNIPESVALGDTLTWQMWLFTSDPETNITNNHRRFSVEVTGSIDPNDKLAFPVGSGSEHRIRPDDPLTYLIRFENKPEATAEAIFIRVVDSLDTDLDWTTLKLTQMSHPEKCRGEFDPYTGVITWVCDNIMLPPNVNPPEGEGFVSFTVLPKPDLESGTEISNTAWIRFDYNEWLNAPESSPVLRTVYRGCCIDRVSDANNSGDDEPTIGDVSALIDALFISGTFEGVIFCLAEADVNQSGGTDPTTDDITIGDISILIDYLFIHGAYDPSTNPEGVQLPPCL